MTNRENLLKLVASSAKNVSLSRVLTPELLYDHKWKATVLKG